MAFPAANDGRTVCLKGEANPGADAEEAVTVKGWMHMLKNVNISRMDDA